MDEMIEDMALKPDNLSKLLKAVFGLQAKAGVQALKDVILEIFALVEEHMPEFDLTPYQESSAQQRWA